MKRMREMWAIDLEHGWRVRFSVCDGQTQFDFDAIVTKPEEYVPARNAAVEVLREKMAEHMMAEGDLVELPVPIWQRTRPDWLNRPE